METWRLVTQKEVERTRGPEQPEKACRWGQQARDQEQRVARGRERGPAPLQ